MDLPATGQTHQGCGEQDACSTATSQGWSVAPSSHSCWRRASQGSKGWRLQATHRERPTGNPHPALCVCSADLTTSPLPSDVSGRLMYIPPAQLATPRQKSVCVQHCVKPTKSDCNLPLLSQQQAASNYSSGCSLCSVLHVALELHCCV